MSGAVQPPAPKPPGFFLSLVLGPDGGPDEFSLAFVVAEIVLNIGFIANAFFDHHFATGDYTAQQAGLLAAYGAILTGRARYGRERRGDNQGA